MKEYKKRGDLVYPSQLANEMFTYTESIFRSAWESLKNHQRLTDQITEILVNACSVKFEDQDIPKCHLKIILGKFAKVRLHFYADHIDLKLQAQNKKSLEGAANASKSSKAQSLK